TGTRRSNGLLRTCAPRSSHPEIKRRSAGLSHCACVVGEPEAKPPRNAVESVPLALPASMYGPTDTVVGLPFASGGPGTLCGKSSSRYEMGCSGSSFEAVFVRLRWLVTAPVASWQPADEHAAVIGAPFTVTERGRSQSAWIYFG